MEESMGWDEVIAQPGFKNQDAQAQANVQVDYFENIIIPQLQSSADVEKRPLSPDEVTGTFKDFFSQFPPSGGVQPEYVPKVFREMMKTQKSKIVPPTTDPDRGVGKLGFQIQYNMANNNEERLAVFDRFGLGKQDVLPIKGGKWAVNPSGMEKLGLQHHGVPTNITSEGTMFGASAGARQIIEGAKIIPEVAAGMMMKNRGALASGGTTALAGLGVEGIDEGIQYLSDLSFESKPSIMKRAGGRAAMGGLTDTGVRSLQPLGRKIVMGPGVKKQGWGLGFGKGPEHEYPLDRLDPTIGRSMETEAVKRTENTLEMGLIPKINRANETGGGIAGFIGHGQEVLNRVVGDPNVMINTKQAIKLADHAIGKVTKGIKNKIQASMGEGGLVRALTEGVQSTKQAFNQTIANTLGEADKLVNTSIRKLKSASPTGDWSYESIAPAIRTHKKEFSDKMSRKAEFLSAPQAKELNISTGLLKQQVTKWKNSFPKGGAFMSTEMKAYIDSASTIGKKINFEQLQNLRSMFSGAAYDSGLIKAVGNSRAAAMKETMDKMMDQAIRQGNLSPVLKRKLLSFNAAYTTGMSKYDDALVLNLAKQGKDRVPLNEISGRLLHMDSVAAGKLKAILPATEWRQMGRYMLSEVAEAARHPATGNIDPLHMLKEIKKLKMNKTYGSLFDRKQAAMVEKSLKELDARGFEGDLTGLLQRDTDVSAVLQKAIKQQDELDAYMSTNFIKELDKADPSGAYKWATSNPAHAKEMMKHIKGDKTKEGQVRKVFLDKMFSKVTSRTQETVGQVLDGDVLQNGVKEYNLLAKGSNSDHTGRIILGNEMWGNLEKMGDAFRTTEYRAGGGIGAASQGMKVLMNVLTSPLHILPDVTKKQILVNLLSKPGVVRYLSTGLKEGIGGGFGVANRTKMAAAARFISQSLTNTLEELDIKIPHAPESVESSDSELYQQLMKDNQ